MMDLHEAYLNNSVVTLLSLNQPATTIDQIIADFQNLSPLNFSEISQKYHYASKIIPKDLEGPLPFPTNAEYTTLPYAELRPIYSFIRKFAVNKGKVKPWPAFADLYTIIYRQVKFYQREVPISNWIVRLFRGIARTFRTDLEAETVPEMFRTKLHLFWTTYNAVALMTCDICTYIDHLYLEPDNSLSLQLARVWHEELGRHLTFRMLELLELGQLMVKRNK